MTIPSMSNLPVEILYLIFEYLSQKDIVYGFIGLNSYFLSTVKYFLGQHLNLSTITNHQELHSISLHILPLIGRNLRSLTLNSTFPLFPYNETIKIHCPNLKHLKIIFSSTGEDIRHFIRILLHRRLKSLVLMLNGEIVQQNLTESLLKRCHNDDSFQNVELADELTFDLSSNKDLNVLKRFCESQEISDGIYMIQCCGTNRWLTETDEDLCALQTDCDERNLFSIRQIDPYRCTLEYEFCHLSTGRLLSVLISEEYDDYFPPTSILSTQRKFSPRVCSTFTFERNNDDTDDLYIRPFFSNAKRLQTHGKRIIVSLNTDETTLIHRFKLIPVS